MYSGILCELLMYSKDIFTILLYFVTCCLVANLILPYIPIFMVKFAFLKFGLCKKYDKLQVCMSTNTFWQKKCQRCQIVPKGPACAKRAKKCQQLYCQTWKKYQNFCKWSFLGWRISQKKIGNLNCELS